MMAQGEQPPTAALPPGFFGGEPQWRELARAAARIDQHLASQGLGPALERELSQLTENLCRLLSAEDERRKQRQGNGVTAAGCAELYGLLDQLLFRSTHDGETLRQLMIQLQRWLQRWGATLESEPTG